MGQYEWVDEYRSRAHRHWLPWLMIESEVLCRQVVYLIARMLRGISVKDKCHLSEQGSDQLRPDPHFVLFQGFKLRKLMQLWALRLEIVQQ